MTKYKPADFADDETSSMGSIQIGESNAASAQSPGSTLHVRFENPGSNHQPNHLHHQIHYSNNLAYLHSLVSIHIYIIRVCCEEIHAPGHREQHHLILCLWRSR